MRHFTCILNGERTMDERRQKQKSQTNIEKVRDLRYYNILRGDNITICHQQNPFNLVHNVVYVRTP